MNSSDASAAKDQPLRIIVGATAVGKSAVALVLAQEFGGTIISADSRQIYRGFDIGTAKPSSEERALVPHDGIDVADPNDGWSAARFADEADLWIRDAHATGRTPVVVGGTGFWISSLVTPLASIPDLDPVARRELHAELETKSREELRAWCKALDPDVARLGPVQWRRAIEVAILTGRRLTAWHRDAPPSPPRRVRYLLLDAGDALDARIAARIDDMFARGWMDEVRTLSGTVYSSAIAWKACGYERLRNALAHGVPEREVRDEIVRETRQYARRQRTWFRRQLKHGPVRVVDPLAKDAMEIAREWWHGTGVDE